MRALVLGGSNIQLNAIRRIKELGIEVIVADYNQESIGKNESDFKENVSTFDEIGNLKIGKKYNIDGIFTIGTDQPIYTAAYVSKIMGLKFFLNCQVAKSVTNKKIMKKIFTDNNIKTVNYKIIKEDFQEQDIKGLSLPLVIKPLDSQGQRGVLKLEKYEDVRKEFKNVIKYSREKEILVEEYYPSKEITLSGYVKESKAYIIGITDRNTYDAEKHIGICTSHSFPSIFLKEKYLEFKEIAENIVKSFKIENGPIYFQMLVGDDGILVNEIACRIGGAYEDIFLPLMTNIPILDYVIKETLNIPFPYEELFKYNILENKNTCSVEMIFCNKGRVKSIINTSNIWDIKGLFKIGFNVKEGDILGDIENATARAGYMIIHGNDREELEININNAYEKIKILDENGVNLIIKRRKDE